MLGGTSDPGALLLSDLEIRQTLERDLWKVLRLSGPIESLEITRWTRAIPVYSRSLERARKLLISGFCATPGRMVFSNYSKDVSIRGLIQSLISG
jgi:protoporphyrinogen oxidase